MYVNNTLSLNIRKQNSFSESNDFATHMFWNKLNKIPLINTLFFLAASQYKFLACTYKRKLEQCNKK